MDLYRGTPTISNLPKCGRSAMEISWSELDLAPFSPQLAAIQVWRFEDKDSPSRPGTSPIQKGLPEWPEWKVIWGVECCWTIGFQYSLFADMGFQWGMDGNSLENIGCLCGHTTSDVLRAFFTLCCQYSGKYPGNHLPLSSYGNEWTSHHIQISWYHSLPTT